MSLKRESRRWRGLTAVVALMTMTVCSAASGQESSNVYDSQCALCHQKGGVGLAGQFPRLAGRVAEIAATEAGRRYLIEVSLFGMAGKVDVDGAPIIGVMPPFTILSDEEIAATLNYLIALDAPAKGKPQKKTTKSKVTIDAADVTRVRSGPTLSPGQVHANRAGAVGKK